MNVYLAQKLSAQAGWADQLLYDTELTPRGRSQAASLGPSCSRLQPDLLVASPLCRALETATLAFGTTPTLRRLVLPLAAERVWHASDVGSPPEQLAARFPHFQGLADLAPVWWAVPRGSPREARAYLLEPEEEFLERMEALLAWLVARPEPSIALVCHWGVLEALTGLDFRNCELRTLPLASLRVRLAREALALP